MKKLAALAVSGLVAFGLAVLVPTSTAHAAVTACPAAVVSSTTATVTCTYTGDAQTWTVPAGVTSATFDAEGAQGGDQPAVGFSVVGGPGGEARATVPVTPGDTITVVVGGKGGGVCSNGSSGGAGGFNGGGTGGDNSSSGCGGGGGGGASDVRIGGTDLTHRIVVAGGGGGDGNCASGSTSAERPTGGGGGGLSGSDGGPAAPPGGAGGNQSGTTGSGSAVGGTAGNRGGGGGGGYFGGAGATTTPGGTTTCGSLGFGGGGGGSGHTPSGTGMTNGVRSGNGQVTITYTPCDHTVSNTTTRVVVPSPGTTCVSGANVGRITVRPGASLVLTNSTVRGRVTASRAARVTICDSTIDGSVSIAHTTGAVLVGGAGDDATPCGPNSLHSKVTMTGNTANTELGGNRALSSVSFTNNRGPTGPEAQPEVEGNTISGKLACSGNDPTITNDGIQNSVTGASTGQCAGF